MRTNQIQAIMKLNTIIETIVDLFYEINYEEKTIQLEIVELGKEPSFFDITRDFDDFIYDLENEHLDIIDDANTNMNAAGEYYRLDSDMNVIFESDMKEFYDILDHFSFNDMLSYHLVDLSNLETEIMDATIISDVAAFEIFLESQINQNVTIKSVVQRSNRSKTCAVTTINEGEHQFIKTKNYCIFISDY